MLRYVARARSVRRIGVIATSVALSLVAYFAVSLAQVWATGRDEAFSQGAARVEAIVVLGAAQYDGRPSPQFAARLDHALVLWQRGAAESIVVTGGKQSGDRFTEAESGREYLVTRGVPASAVQVEPRGASTYESLRAVASLLGSRLDERGSEESVVRAAHIVIVSDPYHLLRARLVAAELGLSAEVSATRTGVTRGRGSLRRNVREAVGVMIGRISGFRQLEAWLQ
ncbi:MAG: hypothetical protein RL072_1379 [Actinomycetota bacterium]|jgi:uncharacterized SAM-binding protein YcdF (DUF218 family)